MSKIRPDLSGKPFALAVKEALLPKRGLSVAELAEKTQLTEGQVNGALYNLRQMGWAQSERAIKEDTGRHILKHTLQTEGSPQRQKGLSVHKNHRKGGKASKPVPVGSLTERIDVAIDGVVDAVAALQTVMHEARSVMSAAETIRVAMSLQQ
jgi:predicted transcriptional regulator